MLRVAIVEDETSSADLLRNYLDRYAGEHNVLFAVEVFSNAVNFLKNYKSVYDIVFMDIEMPYMSGMEAAIKLREIDQTVLLFVTNMSQYAVKGYEVDALSFLVKPVAYFNFALKMQKAIMKLESNRDREILVRTKDGVIRLRTSKVQYVEISGHRIVYHTQEGTYEGYGTLKQVEERLAGTPFVRCNSCYLVNLQFVSKVTGWTVEVGSSTLQISHPKKKDFLNALNLYVNGDALSI